MLENTIPILAVRDLATSVRFYADVLGFGVDFVATSYPWAREFRVEDPDGHVLRFGGQPET